MWIEDEEKTYGQDGEYLISFDDYAYLVDKVFWTSLPAPPNDEDNSIKATTGFDPEVLKFGLVKG